MLTTLTKFLRGRYDLTHFTEEEREVHRLTSPRASSSKLARPPPGVFLIPGASQGLYCTQRAPCSSLTRPGATAKIKKWKMPLGQYCYYYEDHRHPYCSIAGILWITIICNLPFPLLNCKSSDEGDQSHFVLPHGTSESLWETLTQETQWNLGWPPNS